MLNRIILINLLTVAVTFSVAAQRTVTCRLIDNETEKPIKDASIALASNGFETKSNYLGYFQLEIDSIDLIAINATGYRPVKMNLLKATGNLVIRLSKANLQPASFPGGLAKFHEYIERNINYQHDENKKRIKGDVLLEFLVDSNGEIPTSEIKIKTGLTPLCDEEAIRVIKESPKWNPAKWGNEFVGERITIAVKFK